MGGLAGPADEGSREHRCQEQIRRARTAVLQTADEERSTVSYRIIVKHFPDPGSTMKNMGMLIGMYRAASLPSPLVSDWENTNSTSRESIAVYSDKAAQFSYIIVHLSNFFLWCAT